jgi:hypothetical protein
LCGEASKESDSEVSVKKNKSTCPTCGQGVEEHRHSLNVGIVEALLDFYKRFGKNPGRVSDVIKEHNKACNWQKLRYFGLTEIYVTTSNARKRGWWRVTSLGEEFILGKVKIQRMVWTFNAKILRGEGAFVSISDVIEGYMYRLDYADVSQPHQLGGTIPASALIPTGNP